MSPTYYKRLRERQLQRSRAGVAGRERKRREALAGAPGWSTRRTLIVGVSVAPDGRHAALWINGRHVLVGSET